MEAQKDKSLEERKEKYLEKTASAMAIFFVCYGVVLGTCLLLLISGTVTLFLSGFAVDNNDRLYVGTNGAIQVYENGVLVNQLNPHTSRSYYFTINQDGNILLSLPTEVYLMDLSGNVLETWEDGGKVYNQLKHRNTFTSGRGDVYKMKGVLGRTRIVKNDSQTVYRISVLSLIVKILIPVCCVSLVLFFAWVIRTRKKYGLPVIPNIGF